MKAFKFTKMTGAGNDFLIADIREKNSRQLLSNVFKNKPLDEITRQICHRHYNVGADGAVFIVDSNSASLKWEFYNADGSKAEMCGNAARCVGLYAITHQLCPSPLTIETLAGPVTAQQLSNNEVSVTMNSITDEQWGQTERFKDQSFQFDFLNSGVPHVDIQRENLKINGPLKELAAALRNAPRFFPNGANVTFFERLEKNKISSVSFERGVEDFTLACGTGAVAAAYAFSHTTREKQIVVLVPGGELKIDFKGPRPLLIGPAKFIAEVEIYG